MYRFTVGRPGPIWIFGSLKPRCVREACGSAALAWCCMAFLHRRQVMGVWRPCGQVVGRCLQYLVCWFGGAGGGSGGSHWVPLGLGMWRQCGSLVSLSFWGLRWMVLVRAAWRVRAGTALWARILRASSAGVRFPMVGVAGNHLKAAWCPGVARVANLWRNAPH